MGSWVRSQVEVDKYKFILFSVVKIGSFKGKQGDASWHHGLCCENHFMRK